MKGQALPNHMRRKDRNQKILLIQLNTIKPINNNNNNKKTLPDRNHLILINTNTGG
jgi:hypothetical protein